MKNRTRRALLSISAVVVLLVTLLGQQGDVSAASLTSRIALTVSGVLTSSLDLNDVSSPLVVNKTLDLANGVAANQADVIWTDRRTLTTGQTEDLDLKGGGLLDAVGVAINPTKIRAIVISSAAANTQTITLFGDSFGVPLLNTAATTVSLLPGGLYVFTAPATAGVPVTAGTGDIIQVANSAGVSVVYDIIVIGTSS